MKRLVVFSHKVCWQSETSSSGYATDGGFPIQMRAIAELFDGTTLLVPCSDAGSRPGEVALVGNKLVVCPLSAPGGRAWQRNARFPVWLLRNLPRMVRELRRADAVHAPIPGDIGTIGMLLAYLMRKPLFVRHCGNWFVQRTAAERFWKWSMERLAGGRNVMLATGGASAPPSACNPSIRWIFSSSLTQRELDRLAEGRKFNPRPRRLIIVCRQYVGKGTERVIESLPLLLPQFPDICLDVVGSGPALPAFQRQALELGMASRVHFHGQQTHERVLSLLSDADLFCYPTSSDGFPKAVIEAMACGLPVVTTPVSVLPRLVDSGGGVLLDNATPSRIAEAVAGCMSDPERLHAMSRAAMATAKQYSLERWRDEIGEHLRDAWEPQAIA